MEILIRTESEHQEMENRQPELSFIRACLPPNEKSS